MTDLELPEEAFHGGWVGAMRRVAGHVSLPRMGDPLAMRQAAFERLRVHPEHHRLADQLVLCHVLGLTGTHTPARVQAAVSGARNELDLWLWGEVLRGNADAGEILERVGPGGSLGESTATSIEVLTETQLCALHAMLWLGAAHATLAARAGSASSWLLEHLEPDNATRHPWAIQAFIARAAGGDAESGLYASAMMHACCVESGRPDRASAVILLDAAHWLETSNERFSR